MKVDYKLSFEDHLESRYGPGRMPNDLANPPFVVPTVISLLVCVSLMAWNPLSALVIALAVVVILGAIHSRHRRRAMDNRLEELREDYESFSTGPRTFEADEKGWRLSSTHEEQVHSWDEVQMVHDSSNVLYLMTYSGACTLPKGAFTAEQLAQLKIWYEWR